MWYNILHINKELIRIKIEVICIHPFWEELQDHDNNEYKKHSEN